MRRAELVSRLRAFAGDEVLADLALDPCPLPIDGFNLDACRRALLDEGAREGERETDSTQVSELAGMLTDYLERYLPGEPLRARLITLSCLCLAFVLHEPMHPTDRVEAKQETRGGRQVWVCPCKVTGERNICDFCACEGA